MPLVERLVTLVAGIVLGVALSALALLLLGWRPVVLLSGSMAPTADAGDLLITRPVEPHGVAVGDILTVPADAGPRVTHRVVAVEQMDDGLRARLKGDANDSPDPGRVTLGDGLLRTVLVVPGVGRLVTGNAVLLWGGLLAMTAGAAVLRRRDSIGARAPRDVPTVSDPVLEVGQPSLIAQLDPRVIALSATLEALVEDGLPAETAETIARVRVASLLRLGDVETAAEGLALDDGARFVLIAHVDVDVLALTSVPLGSARSGAARDAVAVWWSRVGGRVPPEVRDELSPYLTSSMPPAR